MALQCAPQLVRIAQRMLCFSLHHFMSDIEQSDVASALAQLRRELVAINKFVKIAAIKRSVMFQENAPYKYLLQAFSDDREGVREAVADAIEALKPWISDEQWLAALQEGNDACDSLAFSILGALGKDAPLEPLVKASLSPKRSLRVPAQRILSLHVARFSSVKANKIIQFAREERLHHPDAFRRVDAIEMLALFGDRVPDNIFVSMLQDGEVSVRVAALNELIKRTQQDQGLSLDLVEMLLHDESDRIRRTVLAALRERGEQGYPIPLDMVIALLDDPNPLIRHSCISVLQTQGDVVPTDVLIAAMGDSDEGVLHIATSMLGRCKAVEALPALIQQLLHDPNDFWMDYTDSAFEAICELYEHVSMEPLLAALEDETETEQVRLRAITLLSLLRERTPLELLLQLLRHRDPVMRRAAVGALERHLSRVPVSVIVDMLRDRSKRVRVAASWVLRRADLIVPEELLLPFLDQPEKVARYIAFELLRQRLPLARLVAATRDHVWRVRVAALETLAGMGEKDGQVPLDVFLEALCDRNLSVRATAIMALGRQGERTPVALIGEALQDSYLVCEAAMQVLFELATPQAYELMLCALADPRAAVRLLALQTFIGWDYAPLELYGLSLQNLDDPHDSGAARLQALKDARRKVIAFPVDVVRRMIREDSVVEVREAAIQMLLVSGAMEEADVDVLLAALQDTDYGVRRAALLAMALSPWAECVPLEAIKQLLADSQTCRDAIGFLCKFHPEVLRELAEDAGNIVLRKKTGPLLGSLMQEWVAEAIGHMHHPGPLLVDALVELLDWPYGSVRMKAEQALRKPATPLVWSE